MKNLLKPAFGLLAIAFLTVPGRAITVANYDFTSPATSSGSPDFIAYNAGSSSSSDTVPDWSFVDTESVGGIQYYASTPSAQTAFFNNTTEGDNGDAATTFPLNTMTYSGVGADALPTIAANTNYTLTVALGIPSGATQATYTLSLFAGSDSSPAATASIDSPDLGTLTPTTGYADGTFYDFSVTLSAATIAADGLSGSLGIQLASQEDTGAEPYDTNHDYSQTYFSDVRLTEAAAPEPSTFALVGLAGLGVLVLVRRSRAVLKA